MDKICIKNKGVFSNKCKKQALVMEEIRTEHSCLQVLDKAVIDLFGSLEEFTYLYQCNATRPLSRCYLRSYLIKNSAGAHKEPSKKYKNNLRTLKS